jgi:hypothetical protein
VWLFGLRSSDEVEVHAIDGWTDGARDVVAIKRDPALEGLYCGSGLEVVGWLDSHAWGWVAIDADLSSWQKCARELGRPIVGLIVAGTAPDLPYPFINPEFRCWPTDGGSAKEIPIEREDW